MPECVHFGVCGGCSYQNLAYEDQLELKRNLVEDALAEFQFDSFVVQPTLPSPKPYGYRHMIALSVKKRHGSLQMGFVGHDWKTFLPVESCPIADSRINKFLPKAFEKLEELPPKNRFHTSQIVVRVGTGNEVITSLRMDRGKNLECRLLGKTFSFSMSSFFQNNFSVLEKFIEAIKNLLGVSQQSLLEKEIISICHFEAKPKNLDSQILRGVYPETLRFAQNDSRRAQDDTKGTLFDLYSGVGLIGISLADSYQTVIGIEEGYEAVKHASENAKRNFISNCEFIEGKVENILPKIIEKAERPLHVVIDPPRIGLKSEVAETLKQLDIDRLLYVSCHLEALGRDLKILTGKYQISKVQPVDFFPQTKHVETLVLLKPRGTN